MKFTLKTYGGVILATAVAGSASTVSAGIVNDVLSGLGDGKVVLEDISYSIDPSGSGDADMPENYVPVFMRFDDC